jgi:hypothetical protein
MTAHYSLKLFQIVNKYIPNQDDSREFVTGIEAVVQNQMQMETGTLSTKSELFQVRDELKEDSRLLRDELKEDVRILRTELHAVRDELKEEVRILRDEFKQDVHNLRIELKSDIHRLEVRVEAGFKDQLKWIILLMLGFSSLIITVVKFL